MHITVSTGKFTAMVESVREIIDKRLSELGVSARSISLKATGSSDTIRNILRGLTRNPRASTLRKLEATLGLPRDRLVNAQAGEPAPAAAESVPPVTTGGYLPVYGTAVGALLPHGFEGMAVGFGRMVEKVRRPPALEHVEDAYAVYVAGDSMRPEHNHGDLRFVHPHRPIAGGQSVLVLTRSWNKDPGQAYIKHLKRLGPTSIVLEQLNPPAEIEIPIKYVVHVHRVLTTNELFGV